MINRKHGKTNIYLLISDCMKAFRISHDEYANIYFNRFNSSEYIISKSNSFKSSISFSNLYKIQKNLSNLGIDISKNNVSSWIEFSDEITIDKIKDIISQINEAKEPYRNKKKRPINKLKSFNVFETWLNKDLNNFKVEINKYNQRLEEIFKYDLLSSKFEYQIVKNHSKRASIYIKHKDFDSIIYLLKILYPVFDRSSIKHYKKTEFSNDNIVHITFIVETSKRKEIFFFLKEFLKIKNSCFIPNNNLMKPNLVTTEEKSYEEKEYKEIVLSDRKIYNKQTSFTLIKENSSLLFLFKNTELNFDEFRFDISFSLKKILRSFKGVEVNKRYMGNIVGVEVTYTNKEAIQSTKKIYEFLKSFLTEDKYLYNEFKDARDTKRIESELIAEKERKEKEDYFNSKNDMIERNKYCPVEYIDPRFFHFFHNKQKEVKDLIKSIHVLDNNVVRIVLRYTNPSIELKKILLSSRLSSIQNEVLTCDINKLEVLIDRKDKIEELNYDLLIYNQMFKDKFYIKYLEIRNINTGLLSQIPFDKSQFYISLYYQFLERRNLTKKQLSCLHNFNTTTRLSTFN